MRKHGSVFAVAFLLFAPLVLLGSRQGASAADVVEIFYLPHPPAMAVVKDVEEILGGYGQLEVRKYSFEDPEGRKLAEGYGLKEHLPVAIFVNGNNTFTVGGAQVVLKNFPKDNAFVPTLAGKWSYQDLREILDGLSRGD